MLSSINFQTRNYHAAPVRFGATKIPLKKVREFNIGELEEMVLKATKKNQGVLIRSKTNGNEFVVTKMHKKIDKGLPNYVKNQNTSQMQKEAKELIEKSIKKPSSNAKLQYYTNSNQGIITSLRPLEGYRLNDLSGMKSLAKESDLWAVSVDSLGNCVDHEIVDVVKLHNTKPQVRALKHTKPTIGEDTMCA